MSQTVARTWLITLNNPDVDAQEYIELWVKAGGARYSCGQLEKGSEGTVHVQAYVNYDKPQKIGKLKKHCKRAHFEPVKIDNGADKYCMKEDTRVEGPWEFGIKPVSRNNKKDWDRVWEEAKKGNLEAIPKDILITHYQNIKRIEKDHMVMPPESAGLRGIWYHGVAGAGKSRRAMDECPNAYRKMCNKWWDGYQGQTEVIMEDLDPTHGVLGHHLKIWADRYPFIGESKGGAVAPSYTKIIVTSQYHPSEIWGD